jgi:deoxyadenosine/deoxycytidine kinase
VNIQIIGLPGVGKSTVAKELCRITKSLELVQEKFEGNPWLSQAWDAICDKRKDPAIILSQYWFNHQYLEHRLSANYGKCFDGGAEQGYAYTAAQYELGLLTKDEFQTYAMTNRQLGVYPRVTVYLKAPMDVVLHRIQTRGRDFERQATPEYLEAIEKVLDRMVGPHVVDASGSIGSVMNGVLCAWNMQRERVV